MGHEASENGDIPGREIERYRGKPVHDLVVEHVKIAVALGEAAARVGTGKHLDAAIFSARAVDGKNHGRKTLGEIRPSDEVLVQGITTGAGWFVYEFVVERMRPVIKQLFKELSNALVVKPRRAFGGDVRDGIEEFEHRLRGLVMVLPPYADVVLGHQLLAFEKRCGFVRDFLYFLWREQAAMNEVPIAMIGRDSVGAEYRRHAPPNERRNVV